MNNLLPVIIIFSLAFAACEKISFPLDTPDSQVTLQATSTVQPTPGTDQTPQSTPTQSGPVRLRIWIPPHMDPEGDSRAANLFRAKLNDFVNLHKGVQLEVRIKSESGSAGLLESLSATSAAAPLALPDLIALPNRDLETAALKGLLHPLDQLDAAMEDPDWYDYARLSAKIQERTYGLPFAGDGLALVYRLDKLPAPSVDWSGVLNTTVPLVFPAADPQALFTLAQYQAKGGAVRDDEGRPYLDTEVLADVLIFFQEAEQTGVMPSWLTQFEHDIQIWEIFNEQGIDLIITWSSNFLEDKPAGTNLAIIPTHDGLPFTFSSGWIWAIPSHQPEHQELSLELAEFLTDSEYLGEWTEAAGVLPTRASSLAKWVDKKNTVVVEMISLSGQLLPSPDVLTSLGNVLKTATEQILKGETDPDTAAQQAVEDLTGP